MQGKVEILAPFFPRASLPLIIEDGRITLILGNPGGLTRVQLNLFRA